MASSGNFALKYVNTYILNLIYFQTEFLLSRRSDHIWSIFTNSWILGDLKKDVSNGSGYEWLLKFYFCLGDTWKSGKERRKSLWSNFKWISVGEDVKCLCSAWRQIAEGGKDKWGSCLVRRFEGQMKILWSTIGSGYEWLPKFYFCLGDTQRWKGEKQIFVVKF